MSERDNRAPSYQLSTEGIRRARLQTLVDLGLSSMLGKPAQVVDRILTCATCPAAKSNGEGFYNKRPSRCSNTDSTPDALKRLHEQGVFVNPQRPKYDLRIKATYDVSPTVVDLYEGSKPLAYCKFVSRDDGVAGPQTPQQLALSHGEQQSVLDARDALKMSNFLTSVQPAVKDWDKPQKRK